MSIDLHVVTEAIYLAAGVAATLGLVLPAPRLGRLAVAALVIGAVAHAGAFFQLHGQEPPPPLTALPSVVSLAAWMAVVFYLVALRFARLAGLVALVAPAAFVGTFTAGLGLSGATAAPGAAASPAWSHAHVLLASAGLALLGVAGGAGLLYVAHHRRIKAKRLRARVPLPPLEALDRVNAVALSIGFLLLSLGVVTGVLWVKATEGRLWPGSAAHANATLIAWAIYAVLLVGRFGANQGGRRCAVSAVAGFAVLLFAVVGVGLVT